ncbi:MAG: hypothetical protein EXX96DRAFT_5687 [Benjaminiella poitrasii]|nr:MAG: hypothetical protein EXX96DRAFT_5687 [Benjaminiella poitrasii]
MSSLLNKPLQQNTWSQHLSEDKHIINLNIESVDNNEENTLESTLAPPVRKRTRATADQLSILEDTFAVNVSPNSKLRKQLAEQLHMSERSIQIWFQNRRAKVKHMQKRAQIQMHQASIRAQLYQYHQQQQQQYEQQHLLPMQSYQQHPYYYNAAATRISAPNRAQSVDAVQSNYHNNRLVEPSLHDANQHLFTPASSVPLPPSSFSNSYTTAASIPYSQYLGQQQQLTAPWITSLPDDVPLTRQSMPPQVYPYHNRVVEPLISDLDFPEYINGQVSPSPSPLHQLGKTANSTIPTLVSVPDAGPTVVLATNLARSPSTNHNPLPNTPYSLGSSSPETINTQQVSTVDPSNLIKNSLDAEGKDTEEKKSSTASVKSTTSSEEIENQNDGMKKNKHDDNNNNEEPKDLYLSASALTIGTWHRLKMHDNDLVCVYRPDTRMFAWHIVDGGCHFKMEVAQNAVSSIEFVTDEHEALADVHFDISEPPLFYMESTTTAINKISNNDKKKKKNHTVNALDELEDSMQKSSPVWVQCSDFTEGKQASRYFRHTLKGVMHHIKQELLTLVNNHEETRRLVHFIDSAPFNITPAIYPIVESQQQHPYIHQQLPPHHPQHPHLHPLANQINEEQLMIQPGFANSNIMYWSSLPLNEPIACDLYIS